MAEKTIKSRIIHKHDTEENWDKATNFIPKNGELIIYDKDATHAYKRIKIGDGVTNVKLLGFLDDNVNSIISELTNNFETFNETINETIEEIQTQINQSNIYVSATQPSFECTWFKVTNEE